MNDLLDLSDLEPREFKIPWQGTNYVLTEASADAKAKWDDAKLKATKMDVNHDTGEVSVVGMGDGMAATEVLLLSRCLYLADAEGNLPLTREGIPDPARLVPLEELSLNGRKWPARVTDRLILKLKEASGLLSEAEAKKVKANQPKETHQGNGSAAAHQQAASALLTS